jgi:sporulation protein YlmC with PRC-barrel domain
VELTAEPQAFSDLIGLPVNDQAGRSLGRVLDVRARWDRDGSLVLDELMVGRHALLRRLQGPRADARGIPWQNVVEVGRDRLVVRR